MPAKIAPPRISPEAQQWMAHALALARRGEALASPNPMVGAVLVRNKRSVGEGFHTYEGLRHAEIIALEDARGAARGATLYTTLEPCCHTGRTGPCTRALIAAGVARVVSPMRDPNPQVAGRGFRALRAAGIEVEVAEPREEFQRLNEAFAKWITARQPFVTLKSAMTLDGRLAWPGQPGAAASASRGRNGGPAGGTQRWITSELSRTEVQRMRHASDALLSGIGTVLADDPLLTDRTGLPRRRRLLRVIVDSRLRMSPRSQLARTAQGDVLVFTCASASSPRARALRDAGVEIFECEPAGAARRSKRGHAAARDGRRGERPDLRAVLAELGRRDILSVLLEAGATLNAAALEAGLVDKVRLFYAPKLATGFPGDAERGGAGFGAAGAAKHAGAPAARNPVSRNARPRLRELFHVRIEHFGADFAVEGYVHDIYE